MVNSSDRTIISTHAYAIRALKYIKQILTNLKGETDNNTIIGDFSIPLLTMDRSY